jgi:hypothetical protein
LVFLHILFCTGKFRFEGLIIQLARNVDIVISHHSMDNQASKSVHLTAKQYTRMYRRLRTLLIRNLAAKKLRARSWRLRRQARDKLCRWRVCSARRRQFPPAAPWEALAELKTDAIVSDYATCASKQRVRAIL